MITRHDSDPINVRSSTQATYYDRILRVLMHLQARLDNPPTLDELAAVAHFSPHHFHHIFRGMLGESVGQHVKRLRLERAALRLMHSDQPVTSLAFDSGYENHESFTRAFTAHFGCSPSEYRKRHELTKSKTEALVRDTTEAVPEVRLERCPARRVAFVRHIGPYDKVGKAWESLMAWAAQKRLTGPGMFIAGIAMDAPDVTPVDKLRYDACLAVGDDIHADGEVGIQELRGGEHAILTHRGAFERLGESYAALFGRWLPQSGREPANAPCFEVYRNSPFSTKPEDLLTDLCLLLEG